MRNSAKQIKTMYVVHHSHTDIGYTDLQERVIYAQVDYIKEALRLMRKPENKAFRWNCETYFCVEEFLKQADKAERDEFFAHIKAGTIGISAAYLNFNDLLDSEICKERLSETVACFKEYGIDIKTAMIADINGISMGQRDAMLENGVEFLFTNIHTHHGMYPTYQNQNAYRWKSMTGKTAGKELIVWNGEHYNLGNALGIKPNRTANFMSQSYFGGQKPTSPLEILRDNLESYLALCEENNYEYDFIITSVSGVFSDNAPPETEILHMIEDFNKTYSDIVELKMVSLQELYAAIGDKLSDAPVCTGDLNDWWANGVGSTPYAVKHYKEAAHRYHLCERMDKGCMEKSENKLLARTAQDNLMLYAEHTWGHSSTITCPFDTMVLNLDMRKNSYASKAHESVSLMLNKIAEDKGDTLRYYSTNGKIKVINTNSLSCKLPVEYYIESPVLDNAKITDQNGNIIPCQISAHPRGRMISFTDEFAPNEEKIYTYEELPALPQPLNSRKCYVGAERIRDIVNDYDEVTYRLPYEFENAHFKLTYRPYEGITGFFDKKTGKNMLPSEGVPFFTPMHEITEIREKCNSFAASCEQERRIIGRNIRGKHAVVSAGKLIEVVCRDQGEVFTTLELIYEMPGTVHCSVILKLFSDVPRIDFKLRLGKTISMDIESIFLPLTLSRGQQSLYLKKGTEAFRPGIDQIPGTCMEYYMSDDGLSYSAPDGSVLIASRDVPLFYMGEMRHHPVQLCDLAPQNNQRPIYSWVMNNTWETNFKMDLSGFCEFMYTLWRSDEAEPEKAMEELHELTFDPYVLIIE